MVCCHCFASFFLAICMKYMISQYITTSYCTCYVKAAAFKSEPQLVGKYLRSPRGWRWHIYRRQNDHGGFGEIIANVDAEDQRRKGWSDVGWLNLDGSMGGSSWATWKPERRICHCHWVVSIFLPRTHWGICLTNTLQVTDLPFSTIIYWFSVCAGIKGSLFTKLGFQVEQLSDKNGTLETIYDFAALKFAQRWRIEIGFFSTLQQLYCFSAAGREIPTLCCCRC